MHDEVKAEIIIENVIRQFNDFYNGSNWVSRNFKERILSLDEDIARRRLVNHSHSIEQLTAHIIAWRNFGFQKLTGNDDYDIEDHSLTDWPVTSNWIDVQQEFETLHYDLIDAVKSFSSQKWNDDVPLRSYSFTYLVNGIVQHDYYHYGK
ncbi:MAG: DinB family protein [Bacteroidota bacterium]|nr:DinB family protein [Bacteroidota bacterium]